MHTVARISEPRRTRRAERAGQERAEPVALACTGQTRLQGEACRAVRSARCVLLTSVTFPRWSSC